MTCPLVKVSIGEERMKSSHVVSDGTGPTSGKRDEKM